jgi:non-heme chloroperoxidase
MNFCKKITVIVIPGLGFSSNYIDSTLCLCPYKFNIIRFELPGHCQKENQKRVDDIIDKIREYIANSPNTEMILLIGWSIGGSIILKSIENQKYNNNLSVLIIEQTPKMLNSQDWEYGLFGSLNEKQINNMYEKLKLNANYMLNQLTSDMIYSIHFNEKIKQYLAKDINNDLVADLFKTVAYWDLRPVIYKTLLPICFIFSDHNLIYPKKLYQYISEHYSQPQNVHLIKQCGHALFVEQSDCLSNIINNFIVNTFHEVLYERH